MSRIAAINHFIDHMAPLRPSVIGTFRETVQVDGVERNYITYIPNDVRASTSAVFVLANDGISAEEMYEKSNWATLAETDERKEKFIVFFLEPEDGVWKVSDPETEMRYVKEVFLASRMRDKFCVHEAKYYLVGYGTGGTIAQMAAMYDPAEFAGVASVDAPEVSPSFIRETGAASCVFLSQYDDLEQKYGYVKKDFTVPAWIISSEHAMLTAEGPTATYWRRCAETDDTPRQLRPDVWEYYRTKPAPWTVNQEKEAFRVWVSQIKNASADYGNAINRRLWAEFLRNVQRWAAEPGGDLRLTKDPVIDLGMEYHYEEIDGWMREYYVYIPTYLRESCEKPVPLVFACHGYACSGEIYTGNSEWHKVAEKNGFIVVFPSAVNGYLRSDVDNPACGDHDTELPAWNLLDYCKDAPDELAFFDAMFERVCNTHNIDKQRVYVTGHSLGSLMTQYLGMARPDRFAAIAACSGVLFLGSAEVFQNRPAVQNRPDVPLPVWMFGGENEQWLLDAIPTLENDTGKSIHTWWDLNRMSGEKPTEFACARGPENGRWKDYFFWEGDIPMIRYTWVEEMPHATMTEMSFRIWDEFFSKIHRNENGEIEYHEI